MINDRNNLSFMQFSDSLLVSKTIRTTDTNAVVIVVTVAISVDFTF